MMRFEYYKGVHNYDEEVINDLERIQDPIDEDWEKGIKEMDEQIYHDYNEWYGIKPETNIT